LLPKDSIALIERELRRIAEFKEIIDPISATTPNSVVEKLTLLEDQLKKFKITNNPLSDEISFNLAKALQSAFAIIVEALPPYTALELIEAIHNQLSEPS